jgi:hypothetical protein
VEAIAPAQLIDTSSDALLEEIRRKQQIMGVLPVAIGASVIGFIAFLLLLEAPGTEAVKWGMLTLGILGLVCLPRAAWMDRRARLVRVHYVFDFWGKRVQESLERLLQVLERGHAIWAVNSENVHGELEAKRRSWDFCDAETHSGWMGGLLLSSRQMPGLAF